MQPKLDAENLKICVAVSGGKDSMALLHYLLKHGGEHGITLCALNCDHKIRGKASAADSAFVREYCQTNGVPLISFEYDGKGKLTEQSARAWRHECYAKAALHFNADAVATAHHLNDNAETVLFNLARGSGLAGAEGITDGIAGGVYLLHPLITVSREEIDGYIAENKIPFVTDESNFTNDYTRNKIRHNVLPELENSVPGAAKAIYRFSRIAAETEAYFDKIIEQNAVISGIYGGQLIKNTPEKVIFERAVLKVFTGFGLKDYTRGHIDRLYDMQSAENGKQFNLLGIICRKEQNGISFCPAAAKDSQSVPFPQGEYRSGTLYIGCKVAKYDKESQKVLQFDRNCIPESAVIRTRQEGDLFTKFGGGTKKLNDWFTDVKIPARLRDTIPLVADGNDILIVCGVEISEKVKITPATKQIGTVLCPDYRKM
ncbi:MAG: tRNA lysidine(34) synthetase TilS [Clostridia bacterium]|nr:tRNA lysidine(34) synthetase TilS [Clostridia bacterium]